MPVIFTKSAANSALTRSLNALISLCVGVCFLVVHFFVSDLHLAVEIVIGLVVIISIWMTLKIICEAIFIFQSGDAWRVEITDQYLLWHSPVQEIMKSFKLPMDNLKTVRRICYIAKNSKVSPRNKYLIELHDGSVVEIDDQISGIAPHKVFKALDKLGIPFHEDIERHGADYKVSV